jgi:hypothetical protein
MISHLNAYRMSEYIEIYNTITDIYCYGSKEKLRLAPIIQGMTELRIMVQPALFLMSFIYPSTCVVEITKPNKRTTARRCQIRTTYLSNEVEVIIYRLALKASLSPKYLLDNSSIKSRQK